MSPFEFVRLRRTWVFAISFFLLSVVCVGDDTRHPFATQPLSRDGYAGAGLLPSFEPNQGQADPRVKFLSRGRRYTLFLTKDEAVVALKPLLARPPQPQPASFLRLRLLSANPAAKVTGAFELPGKSNYLIGNDPKKWRTNVPTYGRVRYENIYPGVNLVYYSKPGGQLEYDFVVAPGADPRAITLGIHAGGPVNRKQKAVGRGQKAVGRRQSSEASRQLTDVRHDHPGTADEVGNPGRLIPQSKIQNPKSKIASPLRLAANGDLIVTIEGGEVRLHKPVVYQTESTVDSRQLTVSRSQLNAPTARGQPATDHKPLTSASPKSQIPNLKLIDARYVLKSDGEVTFDVAPYDRSRPLIIDPVLSYSTYLGGTDMDYANAITVDAPGNAYVTGYTASADFPLVNPAQSSPGGGTCSDGVDAIACFDAFVAKLNPAGTALVYSTYLGGSNEDYGTGVALDANGHAYVTGYTNSRDFPVQQAVQAENAGGYDAFVAELSADGSSLIYSTYQGGSLDDMGMGIAVDSSGNAFVSGYTASPDFPATSGALQANYGGGDHSGFVAKFNSGGAQIGYSTFLGGSSDDYAYAVAVDSAGDAYVTGATNSVNFPTVNAFQPNYAGGLCAVAPNAFPCYDAFVAKLNLAGSALIFSTYLGGTGSDYGYAIALDSSSNAYITGYTTSTNLPTTAGAFQRFFGGSYDAFVAKLNGAGSTLAYATYLGGSGTEVGYGIAVDSTGSAFVTGYNYGGRFPTANPLQAQNAGIYDAFVSVLDPTGSSLIFSTYLGGAYDDFARGISLDPEGNAYVTGATFSLDFPTTSGSFQPPYVGGPYDAFVTKYNVPTLPLVNLSPSSFDFGSQVVSTTSPPETITLANDGNVALMIFSITTSGDFSQTNTCGASVAAHASCTIAITFTPTATGPRSGSITITDNDPGTQTVSLTGTGTAPAVSLSPISLTFSPQPVGASSSPLSLTLANTGNATLTVTSISTSGDFSQTNTCGSSVAANASCTINVTFKPTAIGTRTGAVTVTDNASPATQTVSLTGTGTAPAVTISPTSLSFPAQPVGTSSSPQSLTLTNTGNSTLTITSITASGDFFQTNTCGSSVAANASCAISVTFKPTAIGTRTGAVTVTDNASHATQTVSLTGSGVLAPIVSLSPTSLTFWSQAVGTSSTAQSITLKNTGKATLIISSIKTSGDFSQTNYCGTSVAAGLSCTIRVTFRPTTAGTRTGTVTITDNASPATQTVSLTGTGIGPVVVLSPTSLTFASQTVGTSSSAQSVTLKNSGNATLSITRIRTTGDFSQTNYCGTSVAAGLSCTIRVTFRPTTAGTRTGTVTITDNASPYTQTVSLTGTGIGPVAALSPASLTFASQTVGTSSSAQSITLKNSGNATLSITGIRTTGDFSQTNTCGTSVAAGASCTIRVTFKPTATGTRIGAVTITDNAYPGTQNVGLTGTGGSTTTVTYSPTSLTFSAQTVGTTSAAQIVTLSNTGSATLSIASISANGDSSQTNNCGSSVATNASCTLNVAFSPTASGPRTGAIAVSDNADGSPHTVMLTGTGEDFFLTVPPGSSTAATISPGGTATYTLNIVGADGFNQNATFTCTGAPSEARCTVSPASVSLSRSSTNVTVTVATTAPSLATPRHSPLPPFRPARPGPWLLWTMGLVASASLAWTIQSRMHPGAERSRAVLATFTVLSLVVLAMAACGGGGGGSGPLSPPSISGTPPGTYTLTVTATCSSCSASLSHSVNLALEVQ